MKITIDTIPHSSQRYNTPGDFFGNGDGDIQINVSELGDWRKEMCIAVHELVELLICKWQGISIRQIDDFDLKFEAEREQGIHKPDDEPGSHKDAPYKSAHFVAETVERVVAFALGLDWNDYEYSVYCLGLNYK